MGGRESGNAFAGRPSASASECRVGSTPRVNRREAREREMARRPASNEDCSGRGPRRRASVVEMERDVVRVGLPVYVTFRRWLVGAAAFMIFLSNAVGPARW